MRHKRQSFPFAEPENVAVFTTVRVLDEAYPILLVTHDEEDGAWQFLCGTTNADEHLRIVALSEIVDLDDSVSEIATLPLGWRATRDSLGSPCIQRPSPE
jgi:hypothetical protein